MHAKKIADLTKNYPWAIAELLIPDLNESACGQFLQLLTDGMLRFNLLLNYMLPIGQLAQLTVVVGGCRIPFLRRTMAVAGLEVRECCFSNTASQPNKTCSG